MSKIPLNNLGMKDLSKEAIYKVKKHDLIRYNFGNGIEKSNNLV